MAEPITYLFVPELSRIAIHATSSVHPIDGEAAGVTGRVDVVVENGRPDLDSPVHASIELAVADLRSGNVAYDVELRRRVEVRRYPTITGELTAVAPTETDGRYVLTGELGFHGAVRTVSAEADVVLDGPDRLTATWEQTIDIRDFNLKPPRVLMLRVHPEVRIEVELVGERA